MPNYTRIPAPRVTLVNTQTGIVADEWFRFFNNLYAIAYAATGSVTPGTYGTPAMVPQITIDDFGTITGIADVLIEIDASQIVSGILPVIRGGTGFDSYTNGQLLIGNSTGNTLNKGTLGYGTGLLVTNGAGTISVGFSNANVAAWAATPSSANLAAAMTDETGTGLLVFNDTPTLSAPYIDGTKPYMDFGNGVAVALAAGRMWYNGSTGSLNFGMGNGNITQQVGEEIFIYGKASAAITEGQLIVKTGTVDASGVITFGPSPTGLMVNDGIIGVATENIALNGFGRITAFGIVHGITTTGASVGETWADNDTLYYNPSYAGGMTNVKPTAPNIKYEIATVINAGSGGSGSIQVNLHAGSTLGGTDSNVQLNGVSNGQILTYDGSATYWKNTTLTAGSGVSISASSGGVLTVSATGSGGTVTSVGGTGTVNGITLTGTVTTTGNLTLGGTLSGIGNSQLTNSTISGVALGGSLFNLTAGTGVSFSTGTTYNGSAAITINATGTGGTVTSVAALTLGTTGTDLSSTVANPTTTPVITLNVPTASAANRGALSSTDWSTFNSKAPGVTFTTGYIPFGQGTTTLNQDSALFWDNTNKRLGVGTVTPAVNGIEISKATGSATVTPAELRISTTTSASDWSTTSPWGKLSFYSADASVSGPKVVASIQTTATNTSGGVAALTFNVTDNANGTLFEAIKMAPWGTNTTYTTFSVSGLEAMRIHNSAGVSIGNTTDPGATNLSVTGTGKFGTTVGVGAATPSASGAGITFPATQSASTDANTLDDYEEGTWTPTATGLTTAGTTTYTLQAGTYTKIGNIVYATFNVSYSAATGTGAILISLPFAVKTQANLRAVGSIQTDAFNLSATAGSLTCFAASSGTALAIYLTADNVAWTAQDISNETATIIGSITYITA